VKHIAEELELQCLNQLRIALCCICFHLVDLKRRRVEIDHRRDAPEIEAEEDRDRGIGEDSIICCLLQAAAHIGGSPEDPTEVGWDEGE
jgi:hypothetical protein